MPKSKFNNIIANILGYLKNYEMIQCFPEGSISGSLNSSFFIAFRCEFWSMTTKLRS